MAPGAGCGACAACGAGDEPLCRWYGILGETRDGTNAELCAVPARSLLPLPEGIAWSDAAAFPLTYLTAWHMLVARCGVRTPRLVITNAGRVTLVLAVRWAEAD